MSEETKWTPGPWHHMTRNANEIMTTFHGVKIGRIYIDVTTENEAEDAHLIAAAPELYEAAARLFNAANHHVSDSGDWFVAHGDNRELLSDMEAALAKARGEG